MIRERLLVPPIFMLKGYDCVTIKAQPFSIFVCYSNGNKSGDMRNIPNTSKLKNIYYN